MEWKILILIEKLIDVKWQIIGSQSRNGFEISHSNGATHLRTASQLNQQTQMSQLSWLRAQLDPTRIQRCKIK